MENKKSIRLIIFDLSGVFFSNEDPPFVEQFAKDNNLRAEKFAARYEELIRKAEVNEISGTQLWETILAEFGVVGDPRKIIADLIAEKESYPEMLYFSKKLKERYIVVYLTNYNKDYWDIIKATFDFESPFSWGVVSYEVGVRKPAKEGFLYILKKAGCTPREALFIDDSPANLDEPRRLGIQIIQFHDKETLVKDLNRFGVEVSS